MTVAPAEPPAVSVVIPVFEEGEAILPVLRRISAAVTLPAEVLVVHDGAATVFLGEHQARIVRQGEVVRIPAGLPHRWESSGAVPLRAVAVHGTPQVVSRPAG